VVFHTVYFRVFICGILQRSKSCACLKPKGHQTLLYSYSGLVKGFSHKILLVSRIINYNFGLSAFILPKSGVKIFNSAACFKGGSVISEEGDLSDFKKIKFFMPYFSRLSTFLKR
jgi:hypothetical protein